MWKIKISLHQVNNYLKIFILNQNFLLLFQKLLFFKMKDIFLRKFFFESELYLLIKLVKAGHSKIMSRLKMQVVIKHIVPVIESGECLLIKLKDFKSTFLLVKYKTI